MKTKKNQSGIFRGLLSDYFCLSAKRNCKQYFFFFFLFSLCVLASITDFGIFVRKSFHASPLLNSIFNILHITHNPVERIHTMKKQKKMSFMCVNRGVCHFIDALITTQCIHRNERKVLVVKLKLKLHFRNNLRINVICILQLHTMHPSASLTNGSKKKRRHVQFYFWYFSAETRCVRLINFSQTVKFVIGLDCQNGNGTKCLLCYKMFNCRRFVKSSRFRFF